MKRIAFGILIMLSAATIYGRGDDERGTDDDIKAHAKTVVIYFDDAVQQWDSHGQPDVIEGEIWRIVCEAGSAAVHEDNRWIYVQARETALDHEGEALDATSSYESYQSYVEGELSAFMELHPTMSPEAQSWLKERLWERWWWMIVERDQHQLSEPESDPALLAQTYEPHICSKRASVDRSQLWGRLRGGLLFLTGIAIQAVDASTLVPSAGVSAASVASGAGIMVVGLSQAFPQ